MTGPRLGFATAAVVAAMTLAACGSETPPPDPDPPTSTTTSPSAPSTPVDPAKQAPKVRDPLDDKEFVADPCRSLTTSQLTELGLTDPRKNRADDSYESKDGCGYSDPDPETDLLMYVNYYPHITTGLSAVYAKRPATDSPFWTPVEIDGYPAVVVAPEVDRTRCHVNVGTSDTTFFEVVYYYYNWDDWDGRDTCAAATSIATAALATIKAAN
jgi:hypothetical protein